MILVISYLNEDHTVDVINRIEKNGREVHMIDLSDFPAKNSLLLSWSKKSGSSLIIELNNGELLTLDKTKVAWWRRVNSFTVDNAVSDFTKRSFAESETAQAVNGMLDSLDCHWVNPRYSDEMAHHKPYQWTIAHKVGLKVPKTLVTNKPEAAEKFINEIGVEEVVYKAFLAMHEAWRETRLIKKADINNIKLVKYAPVIFQEFIQGVDIRVTVVGNKIFAAEIDARKTSYPVDMRMALGESAIKPINLPNKLSSTILKFQQQLNLKYGAIDLKRTEDGEYHFLEVNPAGQWLFVEERAGLPISEAMADYLIKLEEI
jgi:glutathione synthase/RimK-type ligase-like ATP-grasp enzyme